MGFIKQYTSSRWSTAILTCLVTLLYISWSNTSNSRELGTFNSLDLSSTKPSSLLILTPLKDASPWLDEYFENLERLDYPPNDISLAFLVSDTTDDTISRLENRAKRLSRRPQAEQYESITIYKKDFGFDLAEKVRHGFEGQGTRRAFMARARNWLLSMALKPHHAWVLWLDVDVVRYDPHILQDLISIDKDIVVPNTLWHLENSWNFWGFDRNNFAETEESLEWIHRLGKDVLLVEGYRELSTRRLHLVDMPTHLGLAHVPLDGIGCTFTLVKASIHRDGVTFPTFVFENQVETEGLAKVAKRAGFEVVGVPGLLVFHAQNH